MARPLWASVIMGLLPIWLIISQRASIACIFVASLAIINYHVTSTREALALFPRHLAHYKIQEYTYETILYYAKSECPRFEIESYNDILLQILICSV